MITWILAIIITLLMFFVPILHCIVYYGFNRKSPLVPLILVVIVVIIMFRSTM